MGSLAVRPEFIPHVCFGFSEPILSGGIYPQARFSGEGLGPAQNTVLDFVDALWEALPFLRSPWGLGNEKVVGEGECWEVRNGELWAVCKIIYIYAIYICYMYMLYIC